MDVSVVKTNTITDTSAGSKSKSTAEQLMSEFSAAVAERLKAAGKGSAERSQSAAVNAMNTKPQTKPEPKPDAPKTEYTPRDDHQPRERTEAPEQNRDDYAHASETKNDAPRENLQQDAPRNDASDNNSANDGESSQQAQSDTDQNQNNDTTDQNAQSNESGDGTQTDDAQTQVAAEQSNTQGEDVVATVVDLAINTVTTQTSDTKQAAQVVGDKAQNTSTPQQAETGPATPGDDLSDADLAQGDAQKQNAAATKQQQTQASPTQKTETNHTLNTDDTLKQQQAADIASKVGNTQKVDINVNVTKQSEQLVSQPTSNLGAQAAVTEKSDGTDQTSQQSAAKGIVNTQQSAAAHNLGNQTGQQGSDAQQQAQQNMQMAQADTVKTVATTDTATQNSQAANAANSTVKIGGAEGMSNAQGVTQTNTQQPHQQATPTHKAAPDPQAQARAQVTDQINVQISKAIANGMDKISIQLRPAHLGRVDVQLEMSSDGRVTAVVTADNKDTLDLLKQDSRELERAMREAGLQMNSGDLSFNLRENGDQAGGGEKTAGKGQGSGSLTKEPTLDELLEANTSRPNIISEDRVDITA
ncbi:flagellar hook-length control protein FliK [Magnetovibrio blakemorei]|uniref:Flagellar hook-length control protein-like C-terminal domain-containing protein n=1 Tax=Magnetovibrio blakemorei TaxID=28181 RepID=A0A1E5Q9S5_9PROT|nr:flagellar hook-length control protein FliK [Magnetovibrio blakemorei]OEJ68273.1 hypothetical protein BEN30_06595 [Magnetovibrio blakemorei]